MHVSYLHLPRNIQVRWSPGKLRGHSNRPVHTKSARVDPAQRFLKRAAFKVYPQVQSLATGGRRTSQEKASEILRRAIGPRRRSAESQLYRAVRVGRHVQVGVVEVEPGFGIAEFEIHATAAHANG